jgi:hypothetical protein
MTQPVTLKLELTIEQTNGVLQILGNAPYVQSAGLIALIQDQAGPQVRELQIAEAKAIAEQGGNSEPTSAS